ncbi:MAG: hypothetical protein ACRDPW_02415 [Mycobacteriales bacterium]
MAGGVGQSDQYPVAEPGVQLVADRGVDGAKAVVVGEVGVVDQSA